MPGRQPGDAQAEHDGGTAVEPVDERRKGDAERESRHDFRSERRLFSSERKDGENEGNRAGVFEIEKGGAENFADIHRLRRSEGRWEDGGREKGKGLQIGEDPAMRQFSASVQKRGNGVEKHV